ncbi:imidazole glycerol phosphate synthase subunit HisH [Thermaurantimonas aggregans]|uniref:imidazole glycerol phosphate synthase subunit HisH n=1 Tax=Thermaurantimonas aggregans TaxID=2173829 RepID=UPI0023F5168D|nr:imidazole glycerol phosphate synthase subunit HisH [Thermaurantimonas aggregans]MCX8148605.1 imidazole glycerol phosphate synthase subunit HisH [Thermaurantimonas aggregans]
MKKQKKENFNMIAVVDYGLGNIKAFVNIFERLNIKYIVANTPENLKLAEKIILPGVGAFDTAMDLLNKSGLRDTLEHEIIIKKKPFLGVCVGMQILFNFSEEGSLNGLGWVDGFVKKFDTSKIPFKTKTPHMGWNYVNPINNSPIFLNHPNPSFFYFLHSYYVDCDDTYKIAESYYGIHFISAINKENIFGVQFHPEKSNKNGLLLIKNFIDLNV